MKNIKKVLALIVAMMMVMSMAAAFASGDVDPEQPDATGKTITLTSGKKGHTYTLYQIFTGTVKDGELTGIQWGANAPDSMINH